MKIQAIKANLVEGLQNVMRAVSNKNTSPLLSGVYLKAEGQKLTLIATDSDLRIETKVPVQVIEEGDTVVPGKSFYDFVRRLPDVTITLEAESYEGKDTIQIKYGEAATTIKGFPGREFPGIASIQEQPTLAMPVETYHKIIKHTSFTVSPDEVRPVFSGLYFDLEAQNLTVVGTDSFRLALMKEQVENLSGEDHQAIIPVRALNEVDRLLREDTKVSITLTKRQAIFENEDTRLFIQLVKGEYPDYKRIVPNSYDTLLKVERQDLLSSLDRAALFGQQKDGTPVVRLQIGNNVIALHTASEYGEVNEKVPVYQEGNSLEITFNARFLLDALKNMAFENLEVKLNGNLGPCIFYPENDESYLYLILPLRR